LILRGSKDDLPYDLGKDCQYLDYTRQATQPNFNIGDSEEMSEKLFKVAEYVKPLCDKMKAAEHTLFGGCDGFSFPQEAAAIDEACIPRTQPFPGRP
jgi:hypothetical protein